MTSEAPYGVTALLLCAQSEIEIVETAIAQSSGVAKQAQVRWMWARRATGAQQFDVRMMMVCAIHAGGLGAGQRQSCR